jgi:hypothetical protein
VASSRRNPLRGFPARGPTGPFRANPKNSTKTAPTPQGRDEKDYRRDAVPKGCLRQGTEEKKDEEIEEETSEGDYWITWTKAYIKTTS